MAKIKFEIKEDHLRLLKQLQWSLTDTQHILSISDIDNDDAKDVLLTPFGGDDLMEDISHIIEGKVEGEDIIPIRGLEETETGDDLSGKVEFTEAEIEYMTDLFNGLATALDICLYRQSFEAGHYKTKSYLRDWEKFEPKQLN